MTKQEYVDVFCLLALQHPGVRRGYSSFSGYVARAARAAEHARDNPKIKAKLELQSKEEWLAINLQRVTL